MASNGARPKVAAICTEWRHNSHTDVMLPKLLAGYDVDARPVRPAVEVVSLYMDQFPEHDLSRRWAARFGVPIVPTIQDALTLGGSSLAIDAVLIIGEHGTYPWNEKGQHLYPRREFFEAAIEVIRPAGRPVPVFNDKHLSYSWESARWMYDTARALDLPFMAGSSLPVTWRRPDMDIPHGAPVTEALALWHGQADSYGFHALEMAQCIVEQRRGGESGVASVELLHGEAFWDAWHHHRFPMDLYDAALAVAVHHDGPTEDFCRSRPVRRAAVPGPQPPLALLVQYRDGLRVTLLNLGEYVSTFTLAARTPDGVAATAFVLENDPPRWHFNYLVHHIEQFFVTGTPPYPIERTLLTTGTLAALLDAAHAGRPLETPHLAISYEAAPPPARSNGTSLPPESVWGFRPEDV